MKTATMVLLGILAATTPATTAQVGPQTPGSGVDTSGPAALKLGPIEGLTTAWHKAPDAAVVPLGTTITLLQAAPPGADVVWIGAEEVARDVSGSTAECVMLDTGRHEIRVIVTPPAGTSPLTTVGPQSYENVCSFLVLPAALDDLELTPVRATVDGPELFEGMSNAQTMDAYFGESIAPLTTLGAAHVRTSTERTIDVSVWGGFPGLRALGDMTGLMEWRVDGQVLGLGGALHVSFPDAGRHVVEVGPPATAQRLVVDAYSLEIQQHPAGWIFDDVAYTFTAITNPPGAEGDLLWLASTKHGSASPTVGSGASFTTSFHATSPSASGAGSWLGVKSGATALGQDGPVQPPVINSVFPLAGGAGSTVTLTGNNFPTDPLDICFRIGNVTVEVTSATATQIVGTLHAVAPGALGPQTVMLATGEGIMLQPAGMPTIPGVTFNQAGWVFGPNGDQPQFTAVAAQPFDITGGVTANTLSWFPDDVTLPINGVCVQLAGNWGPGTTVDMDVHFNLNGKHYDMWWKDVLVNGASLNLCATAIASVVATSFTLKGAPGLEVYTRTFPNGEVWACIKSSAGNVTGGGGSLTIHP